VRDFGCPCGYPDLEELGWSMSKPYFNAALLVIDVQVSICWPFATIPLL
jgi:hypothetical protein